MAAAVPPGRRLGAAIGAASEPLAAGAAGRTACAHVLTGAARVGAVASAAPALGAVPPWQVARPLQARLGTAAMCARLRRLPRASRRLPRRRLLHVVAAAAAAVAPRPPLAIGFAAFPAAPVVDVVLVRTAPYPAGLLRTIIPRTAAAGVAAATSLTTAAPTGSIAAAAAAAASTIEELALAAAASAAVAAMTPKEGHQVVDEVGGHRWPRSGVVRRPLR